MSETSAPRMRTVDEVYGTAYADVEAFEEELDRSLQPRGAALLYELVAGLGLPPGARALDVGCREAFHCVELARRFGFTVRGVEPVRRHLDNAARELRELAEREPELAARITVDEGVAERLGGPDGAVDLLWCRDVLPHVADLTAAFGEFRRVLRPGGHAVVFQMTATEWLTEAEAARLWPPVGIHAASVDPERFEAAIAAGGLTVESCLDLGGEWREHAEESGGQSTGRQLLHVSRLLRERARYESRFGAAAYEAVLTNSLWGVYQLIGKLSPRIYVLTR
jgi:SAM-dependent methyltransferase